MTPSSSWAGVRAGYATPFLPASGQVLNIEPLDEESSRALMRLRPVP